MLQTELMKRMRNAGLGACSRVRAVSRRCRATRDALSNRWARLSPQQNSTGCIARADHGSSDSTRAVPGASYRTAKLAQSSRNCGHEDQRQRLQVPDDEPAPSENVCSDSADEEEG